MWSVTSYEFKWDVRKKKVYAGFGIVILIIVGIGLAYRFFFTDIKSGGQYYLWDNLIIAVTNDFLSGLFPLLLGALLAVDTIAWEYDRGTILPLLSQPLTRGEIYAGKLVEKFLLLLVMSGLILILSIVTAEVEAGTQKYLVWGVAVALGFTLETMVFASLGFLLGSVIKSPGLLIVAVLGIFFGGLFGGIIFEAKYGLQMWMSYIPLFNVNLIQGTIQQYFLNPSGNTIVGYNVNGISGYSTLPTASLLFNTLLSATLGVVVFFIIGYFLFRRLEVKG